MNTIRELKAKEKYDNMLKRKNKEKNIYKSKNSTLRIEKMNLIKAVERKNKEIERLNNAFNCLEQVIIYYVIDNVKYDNNTAEYILNKMLMFWRKDSDKE